MYLNYQIEDIDRILNNASKCLYLAHETGVGKTAIACGALQRLINLYVRDNKYTFDYGGTLIVVPASLRINWLRELRKFTKLERIQIIKSDKEYDKEGINIISYNLFQKLSLFNLSPSFFIFDEAHALKNIKSKTTKQAMSFLKDDRIIKALFLSATPLTKSGTDLFCFCKSLKLTFNYKSFADTFSYQRKTQFGTFYDGIRNKEGLRELVKPYFIRRLKKDVLSFLPPLTEAVHYVEVASSKIKQIVAMSNDLGLARDTLDLLSTKINDLELMKLRRAIALLKIPDCVTWIKEYLESRELEGKERTLVVFAYFTDCINVLKEELLKEGFSVGVINGATPNSARQKVIDDFQNGLTNIFLGQLMSAGTGLTLTRASDVFFVDQDWLPSTMEQAKNRIHRIGQVGSKITSTTAIVADTIDENIYYLLKKRNKDVRSVVDLMV